MAPQVVATKAETTLSQTWERVARLQASRVRATRPDAPTEKHPRRKIPPGVLLVLPLPGAMPLVHRADAEDWLRRSAFQAPTRRSLARARLRTVVVMAKGSPPS